MQEIDSGKALLMAEVRRRSDDLIDRTSTLTIGSYHAMLAECLGAVLYNAMAIFRAE